ncbi:flagellin [Lachnotalea glycerini]|jgi:flagellin|uniref:Flagellin n=1 Tax=Lachnotalea glycerini TaxID=1763509 RepID=A0A255MGX0_9FIRM|nr:flagellin [Lachnotalea glycerini]OYO87993.1 flagellin [Lachnotalea glycerini]PXV93585.1 flagellin [Lachnotalea glycerini]RDY32542.1 flagellin [Lachnotalea glycerini]
MVLQHNMMSMNITRNLGKVLHNQAQIIKQLSSGYRINSAADDAAGLCISEKMRAQIRALNQASNNAEDGISLVQTADSALESIQSMLQRMRELSVKAANDTNQTIDRQSIQEEIDALTSEISRTASSTQFNKKNILDGSIGDNTKGLNLQVGANEGQSINLKINGAKASDLGIEGVDVSNHEDASKATDIYDTAIKNVSKIRSKIGAYGNRLEYTISNNDNQAENLQAAESRIRDTDIAAAMVQFAKNNILIQVNQAMLAQTNDIQRSFLMLLP